MHRVGDVEHSRGWKRLWGSFEGEHGWRNTREQEVVRRNREDGLVGILRQGWQCSCIVTTDLMYKIAELSSLLEKLCRKNRLNTG